MSRGPRGRAAWTCCGVLLLWVPCQLGSLWITWWMSLGGTPMWSVLPLKSKKYQELGPLHPGCVTCSSLERECSNMPRPLLWQESLQEALTNFRCSSVWLSHLGCLLLVVQQVRANNAISIMEQSGGLWSIRTNMTLAVSIVSGQDSS